MVAAIIFLLLCPGIGLAFVAWLPFRGSVRWRWWELVLPWIAPAVWLYLEYFDRFHRPGKSLGNLIEIPAVALLPAGYLAVRGSVLKQSLPLWTALVILVGAAVAGLLVFFFFPTLPE